MWCKGAHVKNERLAFIFWIFLFIADRTTKWLALTYVATAPCTLYDGLTLSITRNRGVSWSMFATNETGGFIVVSCLVALITVLFGWYTYQQARQQKSIFFEGMVLIGSISNLVDRVVYQGVIDFIDMYMGNYHWPSFNVADACIVCGIVGIIIRTWKES
jgi:signal peptidase II